MRIVCVHGAGESAGIWHSQVQAIPEVEALDLPGHGENGGRGLASVGAYSDWLAGTLSGSRPLILAGHSMGGAIALELALRIPRPDWLAGLLLVATGARLRVHPDILRLLDDDFDSASALLADWSVADDAMVRSDVVAGMRLAGRQTVRDDYRAVHSFDVMNRLDEVDVPAMAVVGSEDRMTPPKYARFLADRIPVAGLVEIPAAGHLVTREQPVAVNRCVEAFAQSMDAA
ncbi:MAG: alpha/beta fold hydrolase [Chloroflexota bacterium]